jgi:hypothetical protein
MGIIASPVWHRLPNLLHPFIFVNRDPEAWVGQQRAVVVRRKYIRHSRGAFVEPILLVKSAENGARGIRFQNRRLP